MLKTKSAAPIIVEDEGPLELGEADFVEDRPRTRKRRVNDDFSNFDANDVEDYGDVNDDFGDDDYAAPSRPRSRSRSASSEQRPRKKKRKKKKRPTSSGGGMEMDGSVIGGIGMMIGAVIWFVVGWNMGVIFFYPPILFIAGLIAVAKGLFS